MSKTLLLRNARCVATFDEQRRELSDASVFIRDHRIEAIGPAADLADLAEQADEVLDLRGCLVTPGLVNTHHHMYQSLTRAIPAVQDAELFSWLQGLYPIWAGLTPEMVQVSTQVAMAELLLSGCTTSSDHLYIYPNGVRLDDSIEAAQAIGMRFVATRGSMSVGRSQGGLPPDEVVEREDAILRDTQRLIERWHDPRHGAMVQVAVAPCSPFSVSRDLMRESALLARAHGVRLHTHLAENDHDIAYSRDKFGCTPAEYAEQLGWVGHDVWHAHCVKLDAAGMSLFARTRTGVAHCPCSNMRLASGIAPIRRMLDAGVPVGLGVDGSASNDGAHMLGEARQAMLLARVGRALEPFGCDAGPAEMKARDALALATRGGAEVLGRADIGSLAVGQCADLAVFDLGSLDFAGGAVHDPVGALLLCAPAKARHTVVNGRVVVRDGQLTTLDLPPLIERHNRLALQLAVTALGRR
ncbi:8-oxoguanine deaminase [Curvibacter gracilis]|uniref:8-oxoguanine deaminase n=1 Tax=Curvibacter gracilis TaxID=230310 RepID=UPI00048726BF|nr:8-oxoguanine deaminase [Curvibacter gracilis]